MAGCGNGVDEAGGERTGLTGLDKRATEPVLT